MATNVSELRDLLSLSRLEFASLLGVDLRTISRWEDSSSEPSGTARAVLSAFHEVLTRRHPDDARIVRETLQSAAGVGGLGYLLVYLLDAWTNARAPAPTPIPADLAGTADAADDLRVARAERDALATTLTAERTGLAGEVRELQRLLGIVRKPA